MDGLQRMVDTQDVHQNFLRPCSLGLTDRSKDGRSEYSVLEKDKSTPSSLTQLCKQLEERITQISQCYSISHEDRQSLTAVLFSELSLIWQDLKAPSVDTTLTQKEKMQLRRQTFSEVLHICEQLFLRNLHLTETLRRRGVFSDCANRRRVAAQLALDCTSLLNVRSIRCRIVAGIKATRRAVQQQEALHIRYRSREKCMMETAQENALEDDLKEIQDKIGELDLQCVYDLLPCNMEPISYKPDTQGSTASIPSILKQEQEQSLFQNKLVRLKGCRSMPDLQRETLLEDMEITLLNRPPSPLVLLSTDSPSSLEKGITPREDLRRLLQDYKVDSSCETDQHPLIEALTCYRSSRLQRLQQRLQQIMDKKEERKKQKKEKVPVEKASHAQGDVVSLAISPQITVRTAVPRVSDMFLPETIKLSMCPPVYYDLTKETDSTSVFQMDQNLVEENMEIGKIFKEVFQNISTKYLNFDEDPRIEPALKNATFSPRGLINDKLINPSLRRPNPYSISHRERTERAANRKRPVDATTRSYRAWFEWWRCQLSVDDYLNYISNQDSDYLSVLFHLYDSDDDEEAERHRLTQLHRDERRRKQQERINSLRRRKEEFVPGLWNINTIEMGGLGRKPQLDERNLEEEMQDVAEVETVSPKEENEGLGDEEQIQVRLEKVWHALHLPEGQRLDMAIKYSSHEYREHLQEAIVGWEQAARLIQKRELWLFRLEEFEREASDPNRFFQKGYHGSSIARMEEASQREKLNSHISVIDQELAKILGHITTRFNDNISYMGRPYKEKMRWDRTEMLYWLQQERRIQSLEIFVEGHTALSGRLPPLSQSLKLQPDKPQTQQEQPLLHCETGQLLQHCEL